MLFSGSKLDPEEHEKAVIFTTFTSSTKNQQARQKNIALQWIELLTNTILIDQTIKWEEQEVFLKYNSGLRGEFSAKSEHVLSCSPSPGAKVNDQNR